MNKYSSKGAQGGFTLIELIVVIVILGILAATALPKFADLGSDARAASLKGAKGAIASASSLVHAKALVANQTSGEILMEGVKVNLVHGYPDAVTIVAAAGLQAADYDITPAASSTGTVTIGVKKATGACKIEYTPPGTANTVPTITESAGGC